MTRDQAKAELKKAMTDPKHPRHDDWLKNPRAFNTWADGLYKTVPGGDQALDISPNSISVTNTPTTPTK
jgi:hypothetical protein